MLLRPSSSLLTLVAFAICLLCGPAEASTGDRLPEFRQCVNVCIRENCDPNNDPTPIPLHHRLLLWTCPQECDYTCQHIVTQRRVAAGLPVTQFHGKWPFKRFLGMQEPFSVLFSIGNLVAHSRGLAKLRQSIPASYPLRRYYELFAYLSIATWVCSAVFHTRDFKTTEQLDYFAAGAGVLYGMYYAPIRVFRLDRPTPRRRSFVRLWSVLCASMYVAHVAYLKLWRWNYTYNMAANVVVGLVQNSLWSYFSLRKWSRSRRTWTIWPGIVVAWLMSAMSLELLDFPPLWGAIDAHSLWHLGTIGPIILWYNFLVKDAQDDLATIAKTKDFKA
ncbi:Per1-domain-containing protein [Hypoxylon fragiforme]|uniref:Per1-domain-containing protein n=1 Tax=Hypoxylon fragiforme TaxID=63214 RepID=UPI0020C6CD73|nr:Per1-domain-containing protein [Hypoxylon fragiforme]KAI2614518.1 Per1-domain-containing protein [Hypoxylon fragiforme]